MICPYCQHDLEVESLSCPRCFAEYPRPARPFGFGLRLTAAAGAMLFLMTLIVTQCVAVYLPGGSHAVLPSGSKIFSGTQAPDFRSADVDRELGRWAAHQQNADHPLPGFVGR
jgi:hypothetical protein